MAFAHKTAIGAGAGLDPQSERLGMGDGRLENSGVAVWVESVLVFDSHEVVGGYCGCIHSCRQVALSALSLSIYVHLKSRVGNNRFF